MIPLRLRSGIRADVLPVFLSVLISSAARLSGQAPGADPEDAGGAERGSRVPWTASRVAGTPDPPPPYRAVRAFPKLRFEKPVILKAVPGSGRFLVGELEGRIYTFLQESPVDSRLDSPHLAIDLARTGAGRTRLYGLAFHPRFPENDEVFVCHVIGSRGKDGSRVSRFRALRHDPLECDPASEEVLITWLAGGHNGGCLEFGRDRFLYISTGDGTGPFPPDIHRTGQDNSDLLSAILRIDVDRRDAGRPYGVPPDNPFVGMEGIRPEVWSYGFRNPWKMSVDPRTGRLWVGDVGWELWEMIYLVERGGNYGWSVTEGRQPVHPDGERGPTPILPPVVDHPHSEARSITGGHVYRGSKLEGLAGTYVYGDYETGWIWGVRHDGEKATWRGELADTRARIVAFGLDRDGELYFLDHIDGTIRTLVPNATGEARPFPRKLSATGLFASVADVEPAPGVVPYSLNAEPWADRATARRFLALPGDSRIRRRGGQWDFPEGTVLAKVLSLELEPGRPESLRPLETQILHYERGTWRGYTYAWNGAGTDATLIEAQGEEREYRHGEPGASGGTRRRRWSFSGRATCMVCHNHFAGFVLGLTYRQLAGDGPSASGAGNRLRALEELGVFEGAGEAREEPPPMCDPRDESAGISRRARAWLDVNCAHCHQRHGGGSAAIELSWNLPIEKTRTVSAAPVLGAFGIPDGRIIAPGDPYRSVLYYRTATTGPGRMPHLGSVSVDEAGLRLLREWILAMPRAEPRGDVAAEGRRRLESLRSAAVRKDTAADETIARLLGSTSGALRLAAAIDDDLLPRPVREAVIRRASRADEPVRGLFERFLPEERRRRTLGSVVRTEDILSLEGDPRRGRELFFCGGAGRCRDCHRVQGTGGDLGPDLSAVGRKLGRAELLESLLDPSKSVDPRYAAYTLTTRKTEVLSGLLVRRTANEVVLKEAGGRLVRVAAGDVATLSPKRQSLMPELLLRDLTAREAADLLAFLSSLK